MVDELKSIIKDDLNWSWSYGREDFQNLVEAESADDAGLYFFMDPVTREPERNTDTGNKTGRVAYSGRLMLLKKSQLEEVYDEQLGQTEGRWQKHIRPMVNAINETTPSYLDQLEGKMTCSTYDWQITQWRVQEVINMFSENMDGVLVTFRILKYE